MRFAMYSVQTGKLLTHLFTKEPLTIDLETLAFATQSHKWQHIKFLPEDKVEQFQKDRAAREIATYRGGYNVGD